MFGLIPPAWKQIAQALSQFCCRSLLWYGFQKFPPVTSAISMLYERNRSSSV